jgi:hypothetical protein
MKKTSDPDFDRFWETYPLRIGKLKAQQAYAKAKKLARPDEILAGVDRYLMHKPEFASWAHPSSWLNAGRWLDEYDAARPGRVTQPWSCPHVDRCAHRSQCADMTILGRPERKVS